MVHRIERKASIKDVIESLGVPHTEIDRLMVNNRGVSFSYLVENRDMVDVYPFSPPVDLSRQTLLRPALTMIKFVVDVNVGKLATLLRMAGFDTFYRQDLDDGRLAEISHEQRRILLSRDRRLLKRKNVVYAHLVREILPARQFAEIVGFYNLAEAIRPFCRCLLCNAMLAPVAKEKILHRLKPLTKKYYDSFYYCSHCDKVYWRGSHRDRMRQSLAASLTGPYQPLAAKLTARLDDH